MFISVKMVLEYFEAHVGTGFSLGVVVALLALGCLASVAARKKRKADDDDPGPRYFADDFSASPTPLRQRGFTAYSAANDVSKVLV